MHDPRELPEGETETGAPPSLPLSSAAADSPHSSESMELPSPALPLTPVAESGHQPLLPESERLRRLTAIQSAELSPLRKSSDSDSDEFPAPPETEFESDDDHHTPIGRHRHSHETETLATDFPTVPDSPNGDDPGDGDDPGAEESATVENGSETAEETPVRPPLPEELPRVLEALLFVSSKPLSPEKLKTVLNLESVVPIRQAMEFLRAEYTRAGHAFELVQRAGGYVLQTRSHYDEFITRLRNVKREQRMSQGALITLAIVSYRQPITRGEIDAIRGAMSSHYLRALLDRGLIRVVGRKPGPGNPVMYGTTPLFLEQFGMNSVRELPQDADFSDAADALAGRADLPSDLSAQDPGPDPGDDAAILDTADAQTIFPRSETAGDDEANGDAEADSET